MKLLQNKTALITGGSRGIGEAIVQLFADQGCNIAFTYVSSEERANALAAQISSKGVTCKGYKSDAGDFAASEATVNQVLADFGQIDILINNAGISRDNLLMRMSSEQWDEVMQANLKSAFNYTKHVMRPMMKARTGSIINMSSVIGLMGNAGQASYAASKAGMIGFTKSVAKELGSRNIRCNAIAPGFVETDMTSYLKEGEGAEKYKTSIPLGRFASSADIANVALFLASEMSSYVTGQVINACGGLHI